MQNETQATTLDLDYLKQFKVTTKTIKEMNAQEARHECKVENVSRDRSKPEQDLVVRLARHTVSLESIIPNCSKLTVPIKEIDKVTCMLEEAILTGKVDSGINEVLDKLNGRESKQEVSTSEEKVKVQQEEVKKEEPETKSDTKDTKQGNKLNLKQSIGKSIGKSMKMTAAEMYAYEEEQRIKKFQDAKKRRDHDPHSGNQSINDQIAGLASNPQGVQQGNTGLPHGGITKQI